MSFLARLDQVDPLVMGVLLLLILASIAVWVVIVERALVLGEMRTAARRFEQGFWAGTPWGQLLAQLQEGDALPAAGSPSVFAALMRLLQPQGQQAAPSPQLEEDLRRRLDAALDQLDEHLQKYLPLLSLIATTAPYLGLLGTVWGIINAFDGIARAQHATLSAIAPGVSEALVATAMGLFAAIPAAIAHNRLSVASERLLRRAEEVGEQMLATARAGRK